MAILEVNKYMKIIEKRLIDQPLRVNCQASKWKEYGVRFSEINLWSREQEQK